MNNCSEADTEEEVIAQRCRDQLVKFARLSIRYWELASKNPSTIVDPGRELLSISGLVMCKAVERQEQVLKAMKEQSDSMTRHSRAMLILTVVLIFAAAVQIWIMLRDKC